MERVVWCKLIRIGGNEESLLVPNIINLFFWPDEDYVFVGRFSQPAPNNEGGYKHSFQHGIACSYISSTHMSLFFDFESKIFYIHDLASNRNGTFLNDQLIGAHPKQLNHNDEIAFKYKGALKILYRFEYQDKQDSKCDSSCDQIISGVKRQRNSDSQQMDDIFQQQILSLQDEVSKSEQKYRNLADQMQEGKRDLENAIKKMRQDEKTIESLQNQLEESKERINLLEIHCTTIEARKLNLETEVENQRADLVDLRGRVVEITKDFEEKNSLVDNQRRMLSDSNTAIRFERDLQRQLNLQLNDLNRSLTEMKAKNSKFTVSIAALQSLYKSTQEQLNIEQRLRASHEKMMASIITRYSIGLQENSTLKLKITSLAHHLLEMQKSYDSKFEEDLKVYSDLDVYLKNLPSSLENVKFGPGLLLSSSEEEVEREDEIVHLIDEGFNCTQVPYSEDFDLLCDDKLLRQNLPVVGFPVVDVEPYVTGPESLLSQESRIRISSKGSSAVKSLISAADINASATTPSPIVATGSAVSQDASPPMSPCPVAFNEAIRREESSYVMCDDTTIVNVDSESAVNE